MVGWLGVIAGFIILSYYIVVAGWAADYTLKSLSNFSAPIAAKAEDEAAAYRAATPVAEVRKALAQARAEREAGPAIADIRAEAPKSVWAAARRFDAALAGAGGGAAARAALLEDAELAAKAAEAQVLQRRIKAVEVAAAQEALNHYAGLPDRQVRDEGQTAKRREAIATEVGGAFGKLVSDGWTVTFWALLFMLITILVVAGGVSRGIERVCSVLMPLLIGLMVVMVVYGVFQPGFSQAAAFVFSPDPSRLKASGILEALGHAFFTLSLGMGAMLTYGSYQSSKDSLVRQSVWIAGLDTGIALLACLMLFPILFSYGQAPAAGPGLVFKSMPLAFAEIGRGGMLLGVLFFSLLVVAALTSAISLLEVVASYFIDNRGWSRTRAAWTLGSIILLFGVPSAFSFDPDFAFESWEATFHMSFFDTMDYLASNWLLPIGGLLIALYAGWVMPGRLRDAELAGTAPWVLKGWLVGIKVVAPVLVIIVLMQKVGLLDADELLHGLF
jgi:NSS family neurotransmitter:Na+ symporter